MKFYVYTCLLIAFSFTEVYTQVPDDTLPNQSALEKEILDHYQKYNIREIQGIYQNIDQDIPLSVMKLQNMLNSFYHEFPRNMGSDDNVNLDATLHRQDDPYYKVNTRRDAILEKLKQKQTPGLIKEAPNIFELHYDMARGLIKAEKSGGMMTKNPLRAAYHFIAALRYRTLKLTPEIWSDPQRLLLVDDAQEKKDAVEYFRIVNELASSRKIFTEEKRRLYAAQDNMIPDLKDPGMNEPAYTRDKKALQDLLQNITGLESQMAKQTDIYQSYETRYNRYSAGFLLDFALIVDSIDATIQDREKILNSIEYYRTNYNDTYKQNWKLESRKLAYIDLLEMAAGLDPQNPMIPFILGREYKNSGDNLLSISAYEKALESHNNSANKLSNAELVETYNNLGGLFYITHRFVDSAAFYEKALELDNTPERVYQLAKIHTEKTGNYERAETLLKDLLVNEKPTGSSPGDRAEYLRNRFQVLSQLIVVNEKKEQTQDLFDTLNQSVQIHREIEDLIQNNYNALRDKEKALINARTALNLSPDEKNLQGVYQTQQDYLDQKDLIQKLESTRKSMNFSKIYFTMAWQFELLHNIQGALETYRTAESYGLDPDRARKEILRLQKKI